MGHFLPLPLSLRYDAMQLSLLITRLHLSHFHAYDELTDFKLQFVCFLSETNSGLGIAGENQFERESTELFGLGWLAARPSPQAPQH